MNAPEQAPLAYQAHDAHIFKLIGITPDEREDIPVAEQRLLAEEVQAGNPDAMEILISQRLRWIYRYAHEQPELQQRYDLDLRDVMQLGALATIEAALTVDLDDPIINVRLQLAVPIIMGTSLAHSKLVPSVAKVGNRPVYFVQGTRNYTERIVDTAVPIEDEALKSLINDPCYKPEIDRESYVRQLYEETVEELIESLPERERNVIKMRFGIGYDQPLTLDKTGKRFNVTRQRVNQIEKAVLEYLQDLPEIINASSGLDEDTTNTGFGPAESPEAIEIMRQQAELRVQAQVELNEKYKKQRRWLEEIKLKQQMGQIAFVQGELLIRPLPPEVQDFIDNYDASKKRTYPSTELRRILE